jgi:LuxR family maltose regulon positive regulatory protein
VTATEPGTGPAVHDGLAHLALLEVHEGRLHRAERYARESLTAADRAGLPLAARVGAARAALAAVAWYRNDLPAVGEHLGRAAAATSSRYDPPTATAVALLRARVAQGQRDWRRALAATESARAGSHRWRIPTEVKDLIDATAIETHLGLGDIGSARRCLDAMSDGPVRTLALGQLQVLAGQPGDARAVLSMLSRQNAPPATLLPATLALGRIAVAEGDLSAALKALREALELARAEQLRRPFVAAGAWVRQLLRRHPDLLAEHGWLTPRTHRPRPENRTAPVVEPLTARESDVLRRLTEALSTEDIAAALYLSVNTVKTHLKSIYRKLGTSDRSATARRARELNLVGPPGRGDR